MSATYCVQLSTSRLPTTYEQESSWNDSLRASVVSQHVEGCTTDVACTDRKKCPRPNGRTPSEVRSLYNILPEDNCINRDRLVVHSCLLCSLVAPRTPCGANIRSVANLSARQGVSAPMGECLVELGRQPVGFLERGVFRASPTQRKYPLKLEQGV